MMIYPKKSVKNTEWNGKGSAERMKIKKIYRVEMNNSGMPNYSTAEEVQTKQVKYYDEDENVWKIGEVIEGIGCLKKGDTNVTLDRC